MSCYTWINFVLESFRIGFSQIGISSSQIGIGRYDRLSNWSPWLSQSLIFRAPLTLTYWFTNTYRHIFILCRCTFFPPKCDPGIFLPSHNWHWRVSYSLTWDQKKKLIWMMGCGGKTFPQILICSQLLPYHPGVVWLRVRNSPHIIIRSYGTIYMCF